MATDMEESDTEDHERPAPPKRQCTKIVNSHNELMGQEQNSNQETLTGMNIESDYELHERLTREKLRKWQACQVTKGFVDNTINRVLENYILAPQADVSSQFRLFRGTEMEDTAVMMAIRNHGLVHSGQIQSYEHEDGSRTFAASLHKPGLGPSRDLPAPTAPATATTSSIVASSTVENNLSLQESTENKTDEGDEQDFLERAVAEAIKIKGLSALSVDYG